MDTVTTIANGTSAYLASCPLQTTEFSVVEGAMPPIVHKAFIRALRVYDAQKEKKGSVSSSLYDSQLKSSRKPGHPLHVLKMEFGDIVKRFLPLAGVVHSNDWPTLEQTIAYWQKWEEPFNRAIYGDPYSLESIHHEQQAA